MTWFDRFSVVLATGVFAMCAWALFVADEAQSTWFWCDKMGFC